MKPTLRILTPLFAGLSLLPVFADTIHLTNGQKLEGKVLEEGTDYYQLEVQVTKSIKDQRRVPKSEVSRIEKLQDDVKEYQAIAALIPTPDLLDRDAYAQRIAKTEEFIRKHPKSTHLSGAQKVLEELRKEEEVIAAGGVKLGSLMLSAADREDNALDVNARIAYYKMQTAVQNGRLLDAMRAYDELATPLAGTTSSKEGAKLAKSILPKLKADVTALLAAQPKKVADRESGLAAMDVDARTRAKQLLAEQEAAFKKRYEDERASRTMWLTVDEYHKEPLDVVIRSIEVTLTKLEKAETSEGQDTGLLYRNAIAAIKQGNEQEIRAALQAASTAKMSRLYTERLNDFAKSHKAAAPAPTPTPAPEAPKDAPAPDAKDSPKGTAAPAPATPEAAPKEAAPATAEEKK